MQGNDPMSIFGSIVSRIFGGGAASPAGAEAIAAATAPSSGAAEPVAPVAGMPTETQQPAMAAASSAPSGQPVDVEAVLTGLASKQSQTLNWRVSIVDLMKLLNLDSSLGARKELAQELHYTGDTNDSASMNIWLHREVMQKLAANGGKLPAGMQA